MRSFVGLLIAFCVFVAQGRAQPLSAQDFAIKVAISDMFEMQSSELASQKGSEIVKSFAQRMIKDHATTTNELKAMAAKAGLKLPTAMDATHADKLKQLRGESGDQFNATYAQTQIEAHEEAVKLFEGYSMSGDNPDLKAWATKTLPTLREHLEMAKKLK